MAYDQPQSALTAPKSQSVSCERRVSSQAQTWALYWFYISFGVNLTMPTLPAKMLIMDELKCDSVILSMLNSIVMMPWIAKPFYSLICDSYPIFGYRRLSYLSAGIIVHSLMCLLVSMFTQSLGPYLFIGCMFLSSLGLVVSDAAVDSYVIDIVRKETKSDLGHFQSGIWIARSVGAIVSTVISGSAMEYGGFTAADIMALSAIIGLSGLVSVAFVEEKPTKPSKHKGNKMLNFGRQLLTDMHHQDVYKMGLFMLFYSAAPTPSNAVFVFLRSQLEFSTNYFAALSIISHISYMLGSFIFMKCLKGIPFQTVLRGTVLLASLIFLFDLTLVMRWNHLFLLPDWLFPILETMTLGICAQIAFMPMAVMAARVAPEKTDSSVYIYNALISISNVSTIISESSGGLLAGMLGVSSSDNFNTLPIFLIACMILSYIPLYSIRLLPNLKDVIDKDRGNAFCEADKKSI